MPPARRHCRRIGAHYSRTQIGHQCIQTTHAHTIHDIPKTLHARASTKRLRLAASAPPKHASPTAPRRLLRQPRAKRALPALRPATLAPLQPQREEGGVAPKLPPRRCSPPQRRSLACRHPWGGWSCPAQQDTRIPARHCQLRAENQRRGLH